MLFRSCSSFTDVLIFSSDKTEQTVSYKIVNFLEEKGITAEVYPEPKKMNHQYTYAEKKDIPFGIFITSILKIILYSCPIALIAYGLVSVRCCLVASNLRREAEEIKKWRE